MLVENNFLKGLMVITLLCFLLPNLWSEENKDGQENTQSNEQSSESEPGNKFSFLSLGFSMGSARQGVYLLETLEFAGNSKFGVGLGAQMNVYAVPQLGISTEGFKTSDSWFITLDFGLGFHIAEKRWGDKDMRERLVLWMHVAPLLTITGYTPQQENIGFVDIFEAGLIARNTMTLYFSDHFGFTINIGLGVIIKEIAEIENGTSINIGTYSNKDYPYLYLDTNLGLSYRY